jgi:hypothetical protein
MHTSYAKMHSSMPLRSGPVVSYFRASRLRHREMAHPETFNFSGAVPLKNAGTNKRKAPSGDWLPEIPKTALGL